MIQCRYVGHEIRYADWVVNWARHYYNNYDYYNYYYNNYYYNDYYYLNRYLLCMYD